MNLKGLHPLRGVKDGKVRNFSNYANPVLDDLNDPQLQAFDPSTPPPSENPNVDASGDEVDASYFLTSIICTFKVLFGAFL
jgi:hypothetical protein